MNYLVVYWAVVFGAKYKTWKQKQNKRKGEKKKEKERERKMCV